MHKKYLVIGANSFLGKNYLNFLLKNNLEAYGISSYTESDNIYKINNLQVDLYKILNKLQPNIILNFKFPKVSSNKSHYPLSLEKMVYDNEAIGLELKKFQNENVDIHLISTSKLNNSTNLDHPYLKLKIEQENYYLDLFDIGNNFKIHRVENVIGFGDLNFSRILPFNYASIFKSGRVILNSSKNISRNYLTIEQFVNNLHNLVHNKSVDINHKHFTAENSQLLNVANSFIEKKIKKTIEIDWLNEVDYLTSSVAHASTEKVDVKQIESISEWYWNNKKVVLHHFEKFNR